LVLANSVSAMFETCATGIARLKEGPANWPEVIDWGWEFNDYKFFQEAMLFWPNFAPTSVQDFYTDAINKGDLRFKRLYKQYPDAVLWNDQSSWRNVFQG